MKRPIRLSLGAVIILLPILLVSNYFDLPAASQFLPQFFNDSFALEDPAFAVGASQTVSSTVSFAVTSYTVTENAVRLTATVTLSPARSQNVWVNYATQNETAVAGVDYNQTNGTILFVPGDTSETFEVTIIDDDVYRGTRTFRLILSNPTNALLGTNSNIPVIINDNEPTPAATPIYVDIYEPNNGINTAYSTAAGAALCTSNTKLTLWPVGDYDYFRFFAKSGFTYELFTDDLSLGLDTYLKLYNIQGSPIAENDDDPSNSGTPKASRIRFTPSQDGYYYTSVHNLDPSDPANKTYCFEIEEVVVPTNTPGPTPTPPGIADECEYNGDRESACLVGVGEEKAGMNFVPLYGEGPDNDFYRMWILGGVTYTCATSNLSAFNDTNMILYDHNGNLIAGNNDRVFGDPSSEVVYLSGYTGWLYVLVGPVVPIAYADAGSYTYDVGCLATVATLTPTPSATSTRPPTSGGGGGGGGVVLPTSTPIVFPTFPPTPTEITFVTPTETPRPIVQFVPLPTATPVGASQGQTVALDVTLYYDGNNSYTAELTEGIMGAAVAVYDGSTGALLAFGYTNEAGTVRFSQITASGSVRVTVPFFSFSQVVSGSAGLINVRVAPSSLPIGIP